MGNTIYIAIQHLAFVDYKDFKYQGAPVVDAIMMGQGDKTVIMKEFAATMKEGGLVKEFNDETNTIVHWKFDRENQDTINNALIAFLETKGFVKLPVVMLNHWHF